MTREERLELLKQIEKDIFVCSLESTFIDDAKSCAIHSAIEELEQEQKWIPVSERLPKSEGYGHYFLCCLENGIIRILGYSNILTTRCPKGFYYEEENGTTWRQDINPVIAWMPLPEPYKAESEGEESEDE